MKVQDENEVYDEINITPMLDLAYVLLVMFITTSIHLLICITY